MITAAIEHHPENGSAPHVVVLSREDGMCLWFAYPTRERAEQKLPELQREASRMDGYIRVDDTRNVSGWH